MFVKGKSGNPGGRKPIPQDVKDMARALAPEAIKALGSILRDSEAPPAARVSAATAILDRGYGKPAQTINANVRRTIVELSDAELAAIATGGGLGAADPEDGPSESDRFH